MSTVQNNKKSLEVKIRALPSQERQDQKDVSRVFLSKEALMELHLEAGQPCYMWKIDDEESQKREAVAWPTTQKLNKNVVQMFKNFQEICGFRLEDRIMIEPSNIIQTAECVVLRDTANIGALNEKDRPHWEWYLEDKLIRAETVFKGMAFELSLRGPKRSFVVESFVVNDASLSTSLAQFRDSSCVKIVHGAQSGAINVVDGPLPTLQISGIAGIDRALAKLNELLADFEDEYKPKAGRSQRGCGILLHGSRGTGKSLILDKVASTGWGKPFRVEIGMKEADIRDTFKSAKKSSRGIILVDDIDRITSAEQSKFQAEKVLGEEMDLLCIKNTTSSGPKVVVIAATSHPNEIPNSLRKVGRFNGEIIIPIPDTEARKAILKSLAPKDLQDSESELLERLGERTYAYTAEDLELLLNEAHRIVQHRRRCFLLDGTTIPEVLTQPDLDEALLTVRPSAMHDITLQPPKVRWNEIGGQKSVKAALRRAVETPLLYPDWIRRLGATPRKGLLLYGPPGCSKTLSAQAMATETGFNFFAVKGAEILNMYVGESERKVREIFTRARAASPSIIFFDEIDSIGAKTDSGGRSGNNGVNVMTTLLNEMDGIEALKGVTVLAATNKPQLLDLALLRPGRFDDLLYVGLPDESGREEILRVWQKRMDWAEDVDVPKLARLMEGYSGAEIVGICQAACDPVIDRGIESGDFTGKIEMADFADAMSRIKKQVTQESIRAYESWAAGIKRGLI